MSRAFTKERDDAPEPSIAAPERTHPNYVTPRGFSLLRERLAAATAARDIQFLESELESAIVVDHPSESDVVAFGATVQVSDGAAFAGTFTIVGDAEADVAAGKIAFTSPLAEALHGARAGDTVLWHRPAGDLPLMVVAVRFDSPPATLG